jgi:hypothetical protein
VANVNAIRVALVSSFFTIAACASPPPDEVLVEVHRIGLFDARGTEIDAPNMPGGRFLEVNRRRFLEEAHEVPAVLGTRFGVTFKLKSKPPRSSVLLDVVMNTPPITNPQTGVTLSTSKYSRALSTNRKHTVDYGFDQDWELAQGTWTLQLIHEGTIIFETHFQIVSP